MKPENDSSKWQWIDGTYPQRNGNQTTTMCSAQSISKKNPSQIAPCWAFSLGSNTCPQGNRLGKISSSNLQGWSSDAIASSWAFVYFPLVIPSFSSLVRCVAFRSFSFCLLQLSQQARPHQGACLLLGVLFYFPNLSVFVSSYVKIFKKSFVRSSSID